MKNILCIVFVAVLLIISSCTTLKNKNESKDIYVTLTKDYYRNYKSDIWKYKYFRITSYSIEGTNIKVFNIRPDYNKAVLGSYGRAYYPEDYMKFKSKFFFIEGVITDKPSLKVYNFFKERNLIDSTMYKLAKDLIKYEDIQGSDGKVISKNKTKVVTYVVCNSSNKIISQWRTSKSEVSAKNKEKAITKGCD